MIWIAAAFHIALVAIAYRIGRDKASYGVALFVAGVVGFQLFALGPGSFIDTGCEYYGTRARDC